MSNPSLFDELLQRVIMHLSQIYPQHDHEALARRLLASMDLLEDQKKRWYKNNWSEKDVAVITYANSVL